MTDHATEIRDGRRFAFGENWARFLRVLNDDRINQAEASLQEMLGGGSLQGQTFLDVGSGSGLFSLAARRLGATVHSFDFDPQSVACTREMKERYARGEAWTIEPGSVLDPNYLAGLGQFDIVYSWGVLHHTGRMWEALANVASLVKPGGRLFIGIYNDQGKGSARWLAVKKAYNALPGPLRWIVLFPAFVRLWLPTMIKDVLRGAPFRTWRTYRRERGMSPWLDVVDWVGGYPFEVARPDALVEFYGARGFALEKLKTCGGGFGCNDFVFIAKGGG